MEKITITLKRNMFKIELAVLTGILTAILQFICNWVWSPPWTFAFMIVVLMCDWLSAIARDCKIGDGFSTKKSERFWIIKVPMYMIILGIVFNLPKINQVFGPVSMQDILNKMPGVIYMAILSYTITSILKNCVLAGEFDGRIARIINKYIDTYKNPDDNKNSKT